MYSVSTSTQSLYKGEIRTTDTWREIIKGGRNKTSRKIANNTTVRNLDGGGVAIELHSTDIVIVHENGDVTINSGGWLSVTTKERINRYTNAGISQRAGIWYMSDGSLFYDSMRLKADGTPVKPRPTAKYEQRLKLIKKQARQYARDFVAALKAGEIDLPSGGDCWGCCMRDKDGNTAMGTDHIRQHIKDKYYVPSLLVNAGRAAGYPDDQIGLMGIGGHRLFIDPENNIYKYVVNQLRKELA